MHPRATEKSLAELAPVRLANLGNGTIHAKVALLNPDSALADTLDLLDRMAHKENRHVTVLDEMLDAVFALLLEEHVTNRKRLVYDEDIGLGYRRDGKCDAGNHAAGIVFERHIDKVAQLSELDNLIEVVVNELLWYSPEAHR